MALVDNPDKVVINERVSDTGKSMVIISTDPTDVAKVLGRKGMTIKSLRDIFSKVARVEGRQCVIEINDPRKLAP